MTTKYEFNKEELLKSSPYKYPWDTELPAVNEELKDRIMDTFETCGLFADYPSIKEQTIMYQPEIMGSWTYPFAKGEDQFITTYFVALYTLYDDVLEGTDEKDVDTFVKANTGDLEAPDKEPRSGVRAHAKIGEGIKSMSPEWRKRYGEHSRGYFNSIGMEKRLIDAIPDKGQPSIAQYMECRMHTSGVDMMTDMIEVAMKPMPFPEKWTSNPTIIQIKHLTRDILIYMNDYASALTGRDEGMLSTMFSIARDFDIDQQEALPILMHVHDAAVARIDRLFKVLQQEAGQDDEVIAYWIKNVQNLISGFATWHFVAVRFKV